tara:strand:- start:14 stop:400 length:387 start_codon:yes stop_codon:yes gene_type:complete
MLRGIFFSVLIVSLSGVAATASAIGQVSERFNDDLSVIAVSPSESRQSLSFIAQNRIRLVMSQLISLGLSREEAESRIMELTDTDIEKLAANPDQLAMGAVSSKALIWASVILISPIVYLIIRAELSD